MYLFLGVFFLLYGSLHYYFYFRVKSVYLLPYQIKWLLVLILLVFTFSPLLVRLFERSELFLAARAFAYTGYIWMAFIFLFFSSSIILESIKLIGFGRSANSFLLPAAIATLIVFYGFFEARSLKVEKVFLSSPFLKKDEIIRVVQISDLHLGIMIKDRFLSKVIDEINKLEPDILVSTGDLVDGQSNDIAYLTDYFHKVKTTYGKFAVLGNHEFYVGLKNSISFLEKSGFKVLRNEYVRVKDNFFVAGIDDDTIQKNIDEKAVLKNIDNNAFVLFLKHKPKVSKDALGLFDLQLSGHTHNGQIFPFTLIVKIFFPVRSGLINLSSQDREFYLYTSRGTGTWGPPVRFFSRPEITLFQIMGKNP